MTSTKIEVGLQPVDDLPDLDALADRTSFDKALPLAPPEAGRPHQAGIAFTPVNPGRIVGDIAGTVWLDTASRALTELVFRYVGLPSTAERAGVGGTVSYREFANGVVLADRWRFRMIPLDPFALRGREWGSAAQIVREVGVVGGELAMVEWEGQLRWEAPLGRLIARVVDCAGNPVPGVAMYLEHTDYSARSDASGRIEIRQVLPGPYVAALRRIDNDIIVPWRLQHSVRFEAKRETTSTEVLVVSSASRCSAAAIHRLRAAP